MTQNKIQPTSTSAEAFVAAVPNDRRRRDAQTLLGLMGRLTGKDPVMWGPTMIGFGSYHYRYASGREGDALAVGFSPRSANLALYGLTYAPGSTDLLERLGKHRTGTACLYVNKLDDVDVAVLEELITLGRTHMVTENHMHRED
ncbi:DUF1801 domain-containing protein [Arthrobacter sp. H5]|uniref:DUF1801 domain-containing protein n=1 Tax=Arthrobacter sp. H5 TaxID=1267973 RepID=UPI00047FC8AD|nr:DUF1801 domain-containing protein [Arthrobacter sp. H5]